MREESHEYIKEDELSNRLDTVEKTINKNMDERITSQL